MNPKLLRDVEAAVVKALAAAAKQWPIGAQVAFPIQSGQKNLSTGVIVRHRISVWACGDGTVAHAYVNAVVEHDQAKPNSRYRYRTVDVHNLKVLT